MPIKTCVCKNEWQDRRYGLHQRVANQTSTTSARGYRCTACGKDIISISRTPTKKAEPAKGKKNKKQKV